MIAFFQWGRQFLFGSSSPQSYTFQIEDAQEEERFIRLFSSSAFAGKRFTYKFEDRSAENLRMMGKGVFVDTNKNREFTVTVSEQGSSFHSLITDFFNERNVFLESQKGKLQELKNSSKSTKDQIDGLKNSLEEECTKRASYDRAFMETVRLKESIRELESLEIEIGSLTKKLEKNQEQVFKDEIQDETHQLESKKKEKQTEKASLEERIESLQEKKRFLVQKHEEFKDTARQYPDIFQDKKTLEGNLSQLNEKLRLANKEKKKPLQGLRKQIQTQKGNLTNLESELKPLQEQKQALLKEKEELEKRLKALQPFREPAFIQSEKTRLSLNPEKAEVFSKVVRAQKEFTEAQATKNFRDLMSRKKELQQLQEHLVPKLFSYAKNLGNLLILSGVFPGFPKFTSYEHDRGDGTFFVFHENIEQTEGLFFEYGLNYEATQKGIELRESALPAFALDALQEETQIAAINQAYQNLYNNNPPVILRRSSRKLGGFEFIPNPSRKSNKQSDYWSFRILLSLLGESLITPGAFSQEDLESFFREGLLLPKKAVVRKLRSEEKIIYGKFQKLDSTRAKKFREFCQEKSRFFVSLKLSPEEKRAAWELFFLIKQQCPDHAADIFSDTIRYHKKETILENLEKFSSFTGGGVHPISRKYETIKLENLSHLYKKILQKMFSEKNPSDVFKKFFKNEGFLEELSLEDNKILVSLLGEEEPTLPVISRLFFAVESTKESFGKFLNILQEEEAFNGLIQKGENLTKISVGSKGLHLIFKVQTALFVAIRGLKDRNRELLKAFLNKYEVKVLGGLGKDGEVKEGKYEKVEKGIRKKLDKEKNTERKKELEIQLGEALKNRARVNKLWKSLGNNSNRNLIQEAEELLELLVKSENIFGFSEESLEKFFYEELVTRENPRAPFYAYMPNSVSIQVEYSANPTDEKSIRAQKFATALKEKLNKIFEEIALIDQLNKVKRVTSLEDSDDKVIGILANMSEDQLRKLNYAFQSTYILTERMIPRYPNLQLKGLSFEAQWETILSHRSFDFFSRIFRNFVEEKETRFQLIDQVFRDYPNCNLSKAKRPIEDSIMHFRETNSVPEEIETQDFIAPLEIEIQESIRKGQAELGPLRETLQNYRLLKNKVAQKEALDFLERVPDIRNYIGLASGYVAYQTTDSYGDKVRKAFGENLQGVKIGSRVDFTESFIRRLVNSLSLMAPTSKIFESNIEPLPEDIIAFLWVTKLDKASLSSFFRKYPKKQGKVDLVSQFFTTVFSDQARIQNAGIGGDAIQSIDLSDHRYAPKKDELFTHISRMYLKSYTDEEGYSSSTLPFRVLISVICARLEQSSVYRKATEEIKNTWMQNLKGNVLPGVLAQFSKTERDNVRHKDRIEEDLISGGAIFKQAILIFGQIVQFICSLDEGSNIDPKKAESVLKKLAGIAHPRGFCIKGFNSYLMEIQEGLYTSVFERGAVYPKGFFLERAQKELRPPLSLVQLVSTIKFEVGRDAEFVRDFHGGYSADYEQSFKALLRQISSGSSLEVVVMNAQQRGNMYDRTAARAVEKTYREVSAVIHEPEAPFRLFASAFMYFFEKLEKLGKNNADCSSFLAELGLSESAEEEERQLGEFLAKDYRGEDGWSYPEIENDLPSLVFEWIIRNGYGSLTPDFFNLPFFGGGNPILLQRDEMGEDGIESTLVAELLDISRNIEDRTKPVSPSHLLMSLFSERYVQSFAREEEKKQ